MVGSSHAQNSFFVIVRGVGTAGSALLVTLMISKTLPAKSASLWVLSQQAASLLALFEGGLQSVTSRSVSNALARDREDQAIRAVLEIRRIVLRYLAYGLVAVVGYLMILPLIAPWSRSVPGYLLPAGLIACQGCVAIVLAPLSAYFVSMLQARFVAVTLGAARLAYVVSVALILRNADPKARLPMAAASLLLADLTAAGVLIAIIVVRKRRLPRSDKPDEEPASESARSVLPTLNMWTVAGAVIAHVDLLVLSVLRPRDIVPYGVALSLAGLISGILNGLSSTTMRAITQSVVQVDRNEHAHLSSVALAFVRLILVALLSSFASVIVFVSITHSATVIAPMAIVLTSGLCIRLMVFPIVAYLLTKGDISAIRHVPLWEAGLNFATSIIFCRLFGGVGVASGTLLGALLGAGLVLRHGLAATPDGDLRRGFTRVIGPGLATAAIGLAAAVGGTRWVPICIAAVPVLLVVGAHRTIQFFRSLEAGGIVDSRS